MLAVLDWRLAVGLVIYLGATFAVVVRGRHRAVRESSDEMGALGRLYGGIEERLVAAEDLRSNGAATHIAWRFVEDSSVALASAVRRERAFLTMWWFVQMALAAGWVVVLVLGAWTISNDLASIGTIFLLYQYVLLIGRPLEDLVHEFETVQKANGAMVRVLDLLAVEPKVLDEGHVVASRPGRSPSDSSTSTSTTATTSRCCATSRSNSVPVDRSASSGGRAAARRRSRGWCCGSSNRPAVPCCSAGSRSSDIPVDELRAACRARVAGGRTVRRHHPRQRGAVRRLDRRRASRRRAPRSVGLDASGRGRHPSSTRCIRHRAVRRPGAAAVVGAGVDARSGRPRVRRGDGADRPPDRASDRSRDRPTDGRPDDPRHRPPTLDAARRRRHRSCSTTATWSSSGRGPNSSATTRAASPASWR